MRRALAIASAAGLLGLVVWWLTCLPRPLFDVPYSAVVRARSGELLSARVASDGQWRLPPTGAALDARYAEALRLFEDEYYAYHPGINPVAVAGALRQNWRAGRVVRGGSTITQQTVRLMRGSPPRTLAEKCVEALWALRLELTYSKADILALYAAHAPFGGNVVGLDAAAWRYYGREAQHLSWGEAAALAVLPNAPGVLFPGRAQGAYRAKRDRLLDKLHDRGHLDGAALVLAKAEPLPGAPHPLPHGARHLLHTQAKRRPAGPTSTPAATLDAGLQRAVREAVAAQHARTRGNGVHHAAVLVLDVATGEPLAYVGNTDCRDAGAAGRDVDVVRARRSSGSLLKPFLYRALLREGLAAPSTLLADIPTLIAGYAPQNFDLGYDGAVRADEALTRSLNVPYVRQLRRYGVPRFLTELRGLGFATLDRPAEDYGLSLILGGGEVTPWDVAQAYRGLALEAPACSATFLTLEALTALTRPGDLAAWRSFARGRRVAWKTGTSYGHRDAWAVGVTPEYVVAAWTGNADGEGRHGLTGARVAAPLLFEVFDALPPTGWFEEPVREMAEVVLCGASGLQAGRDCPAHDTTLLPPRGERLPVCPYHERVWVDAAGERVDAACAPLADARAETAFALPPAWGRYYRQRHAGYRGALPWAAGCGASGEQAMAVVYPRARAALTLPRDLDGTRQAVAFEVAHAEPGRTLHWYLDGRPAGQTATAPHQRPLRPPPGVHRLTVVDDRGRRLTYDFAVEE